MAFRRQNYGMKRYAEFYYLYVKLKTVLSKLEEMGGSGLSYVKTHDCFRQISIKSHVIL